MPSISEVYHSFLADMIKNSAQSQTITEENVYQPGNLLNRKYVDKVVSENLFPESKIINIENMYELQKLSAQGKSCLILMEHYSNFDLPAFIYLLTRSGEAGKAAADAVISIAGMKLNEDSPAVLAFTEAYSRIVIYPSRYHDSITDPEKLKEERKKSNIINRAALRNMIRYKHSGHIILVFPSGTRYRPGKPDTKRGLKEIDSYIRAFDHMVLISSGGNILRVHPSGEMKEDILIKDTVFFKVSPIIDCEKFRNEAKTRAPEDADIRQFIVDQVMGELDVMHEEIEKVREPKTP